MLVCLKGFGVDSDPQAAKKDRNEFIQQLYTAHLYCPDSVINAAHEFLSNVHTGVKKSEEERQHVLRHLVAEISKDLHGRFRKKKSVFRFLRST